MTLRPLTLILCLAATGALAHDKVKDPQVKARMALMEEIKQATGVLGNMAKQPATYDQAAASAARDSLISLSARIAPAFEPRATDPVSEANPAIWDNWDDFTTLADDLTRAAKALDPTSAEGVSTGMRGIGGACGGCHQPYRL